MNVGRGERWASALLGAGLLSLLARPSRGNQALALAGAPLLYRGVTGHCHAYQALGVNRAEPHAGADEPLLIERSITIGLPARALYDYWLAPGHLARIMAHFAEITPAGNGALHWRVRSPLGKGLEWDGETVETRDAEYIRWRSLPGASVPNQGFLALRPAPRDLGTEAILHLEFDAQGPVGPALSKVFGGVPSLVAERALARFKSLVETGEIPTNRHAAAARDAG